LHEDRSTETRRGSRPTSVWTNSSVTPSHATKRTPLRCGKATANASAIDVPSSAGHVYSDMSSAATVWKRCPITASVSLPPPDATVWANATPAAANLKSRPTPTLCKVVVGKRWRDVRSRSEPDEIAQDSNCVREIAAHAQCGVVVVVILAVVCLHVCVCVCGVCGGGAFA
jgi:hypothetical protein